MLKSIEFLRGKSRGNRLLRVARNDICSVGRSMIEMLGVLAIVGVLSVGGIAGYSKAMEKFKLNKTISEYNYMLFGVLEHLDDLKHVPAGYKNYDFVDWIQALQWYKTNEMNGMLLVDFFLGGWQATDNGNKSANFSPKLCVEMFNNIMTPLHSAVYSINTFNSTKGDITFYGDAYCSNGRMCLSNATLAQIKSACEHCDASGVCCITIRFPL